MKVIQIPNSNEFHVAQCRWCKQHLFWWHFDWNIIYPSLSIWSIINVNKHWWWDLCVKWLRNIFVFICIIILYTFKYSFRYLCRVDHGHDIMAIEFTEQRIFFKKTGCLRLFILTKNTYTRYAIGSALTSQLPSEEKCNIIKPSKEREIQWREVMQWNRTRLSVRLLSRKCRMTSKNRLMVLLRNLSMVNVGLNCFFFTV